MRFGFFVPRVLQQIPTVLSMPDAASFLSQCHMTEFIVFNQRNDEVRQHTVFIHGVQQCMPAMGVVRESQLRIGRTDQVIDKRLIVWKRRVIGNHRRFAGTRGVNDFLVSKRQVSETTAADEWVG